MSDAPGARAATCAIRESRKSAPAASTLAPRSSVGHGVRHAATRQSGSATISPTGTANRFAITDTSGTAPDIRAMSGAQPMEAATDALTLRVTNRSRGPRRADRAAAMGSPRRNIPPVASAESTNDTSNAASGENTQTASRLTPSARGAHGRRRHAIESSCTVSIHAARLADPLPPAKSA